MNRDLWLVLVLAGVSALGATLSGAQVVGILRLRREFRARIASVSEDYASSDDAALSEDEIEMVYQEPRLPRGFPTPESLARCSPTRRELVLARVNDRIESSRNRQLAVTTIGTVVAGATAWPLGAYSLQELRTSLSSSGISDVAYARSLGAMVLLITVFATPIGDSMIEPAIRANARYWRRRYREAKEVADSLQ